MDSYPPTPETPLFSFYTLLKKLVVNITSRNKGGSMLEFFLSLFFLGEADINENFTVYAKYNPPKKYEVKIEYHTSF